jgi:release factor glutamine methyltransferase
MAEAEKLHKETAAIRWLVEELSGMKANELFLNYDQVIETSFLNHLEEAISRYLYQNEPVQYILCYSYFYGMKIKVNHHVLIPRPETEQLTELTLEAIGSRKNLSVLDMCTGSGAIALAVKKMKPDNHVIASDISRDAVMTARENASVHGLDIECIVSDLFSEINGKFDVLISNPPYIADNDEVDPLVYENEPHLALYAGENGLFFYRKILETSSPFMNRSFLIAFEIPDIRDELLLEIAKTYYPDSEVSIAKDFSRKSRFLFIKNYWR